MSIEELDTKQELGRWLLEYLEAEGLPMTSVQGLQSAVTPGNWTALTLEEGWANLGGGFSPAAYRTIPGGGVQLRGAVTHATAVSTSRIAEIPAGLAPKERLIFDGQASITVEIGVLALPRRIDVAGDELVYAFNPEGTVSFLSLSNVIFWPGS